MVIFPFRFRHDVTGCHGDHFRFRYDAISGFTFLVAVCEHLRDTKLDF